MKKFFVGVAVALLGVFCFAGTVFAVGSDAMGIVRTVSVVVGTRYKEPLMDLVQKTFEAEGYHVRQRTGVDLIMDRPLPSSLEWTLRSAKGMYWRPEDPVRYGITPSIERIALSVVRKTTTTTGVEGTRILVMSPDTMYEGDVADEDRERSEKLLKVLEGIKTEAEAREVGLREADPYYRLLSPDIR